MSGPALAELRREREQHETDGDVEPEDPLPRDPFDDGSADERAHRDGEARDARPGAEREPAPLRATAALRIVSVSGVTIAPPTPWKARAAISQSVDGASAAAADAAVKMPTPRMNSRFRPKRSPSAAPVSRKTANVSVYAFTIHSSCSIDAPRSTRITGSAVETTRLSSTTMKSAIEVTANVQRVRVPAFM